MDRDKNLDQKFKYLEDNYGHSKKKMFISEKRMPDKDTHYSLKADELGSTLLEDFILCEKLTLFDGDRIPERVVFARGTAAHGVIKLSKSLKKYARAHFLTHLEEETPAFVRFSTESGFRNSIDLARDVRGIAMKFYTKKGNFGNIRNNIPVFFI